MELELRKQKVVSKEMLKKVLCIFMAVLMISSSFSGTLNVFAAEIRALGSVTDGNVTDGNVTDGNVTDGNVTDGNVTGGNVTNGNIDISQIERIEVADIEIIEGTKLVTYYWGINDEGESEGTFRIYDIEPTKLTLVYKDGSKYTAKASKIEKKTGLYFSVEHDQWGNFDWETNTYPDTWWDVGEHKATAILTNDSDVHFETEFTVTITETPIEHIEVEPEEFIVGCLPHNDDGGYDLEPSFVTVYLKNGEKISGSLDEVEYELGYFAEVTTDKIEQNNGCVGKYIETLTYMNVSADFVVNIIESPIESIEIEPIEIIEHTHGYPDWSAGPNGETTFVYSSYYMPEFENIKVRFKDGSLLFGSEKEIEKETGYNFDVWYHHWDVAYCGGEDPECGEICQGHRDWTTGEHKENVSFMGFETEFTIEIVENPIESIEIESFEKNVMNFSEDGYVYGNVEPKKVTINFKKGNSISGTVEELAKETGYIFSLGWSNRGFECKLNEGENVLDFYVFCCDDMYYAVDMASGPFFYTEYNVTVKQCEHTDTTYYPELPPTCEYSGYTEGTYCNDCENWIEGRDWIDEEPPHVDENNDNLCDFCNREIEENIFEKINASVWAAATNCYPSDCYFDSGTQPDDNFVHWYLVYPGTGALSDYYSEETCSYTIPYDDYIAIVDKYFTNHSDMKGYLSKKGYFIDNTNEMLEFPRGGMGGGLITDLLSVYENGDGTYTLQGIWADPFYSGGKHFSSLTEGYDYYYYDTYRDDFGIIRKNWALIESAFEVTVIETEDGFKVDGYEESDYYIINDELYHIQKNGSKIKYNEFSYDTGDGALVVDDGSGNFFEDKLILFENNDSYWYIPGETYTVRVGVEEGYELVSVVLIDDNGEQILEEIYPGEYSITPVGNAHIEINSEWTGSTEHRHNYISSVTTPATCTKTGVKTYTCSCGDSYTESIKATGHKETTLKAVSATCTKTGLTAGKKCSVCGTITVAQRTVAKTAHKEIAVAGKSATYTSTGLTAGKKCSVCGKITVAQKTIAKLTLGKVDGLKAKKVKVAKKSEITLAWNAVTGAKGYEIYQQNGSSWKKIKTTSGTSYAVKKLKSNKTYKFKVRAVVDGASGAYSSTLKVETIPATISKLTLKAGSKQLTASWSKVSDISGYEVQYSTSKKFTKKTTKTVKVKKSSKKTTVKKLKKGKKYYVRIRTYKTVNGKKIYSDWSTVKNVKVK